MNPHSPSGQPSHGPVFTAEGAHFHVWAPSLSGLALRLDGHDHPLLRAADGWWTAEVAGAGHGARYALVLPDGHTRPDPSSRWQPDGVHGPSCLFDPGRHAGRNGGFLGVPREDLVFYELHVGTFTPEGTLDAAAGRLADLAALGVTCVELMPVQPFPGARNWGYDGVFPWAVHEAYGGPAALQRFVDQAHGLRLAVCLDVVHNHLGPEGNYTGDFGPYFTARHHSPWGDGLDFDGPGAAPVRAFMVGAALQWLRDFRVDALRLDATHAITDAGPRHLVAELCAAASALARRSGRHLHVVAENDENDRKVLDPPPAGWGCSAVAADDLHHALHAFLTGERERFLADFGSTDHLRRSLASGFAYQGERSAFRGCPHGTGVAGLAPSRFVVCAQNHDQVGNRPLGERLSRLVPREALHAVATLTLLGSALPLLFMGEEYGEERPFLYFTSHTDPALARAVSEGRRAEFIALGAGVVPDPQDQATFLASKLTHARDGWHGALLDHHRHLLAVRRRHRKAVAAAWPRVEVYGRVFTLRRPGLLVRANLSPVAAASLPAWGWQVREG
jgi:maltooligosyltrehalose trehalohydrolase